MFGKKKNGFCRQRGLAMILALFFVLLALVIVTAVLASTSNSATNSLSVQTKNQTFNAAETGLYTALYKIDANKSIASGTKNTGVVGGYTYNWEVVKNNLGHASSTTASDVNPAYSSVFVGPNQAYLEGWASSITGGRTVYVEAIAVPGPPLSFTGGAIVSGQTAQISHEQITDTSGKSGADIHGQQITASGGGQTPDGNSYATCNVSGCNAITGLDGSAHTNWPPPTFLTAGQLAGIQSSALAAAQSGGSNVYVNGDWTGGGTWGTSSGSCTVYINGNVTLSGNAKLTNYCTTTVVTGNWTMSGNVQYTILPASTTHATYVLGTGGATFNGTTNTAGFIYSANGPITLNGGGHGTFSGVLYSPFNITMNGGGASSFNYDPIQSQVHPPNPNLVPIAQWEY
ncbi:MAG: hypothetical protein M3007_05625 [Candidatus Eremiobacteraeota bacterium]|nr:hypothetical protein [Candidatus Eremiobacteraeota bacterium]